MIMDLPICGGGEPESSPLGIIDNIALTTDCPFYALLELTHRCNLRCPHCYLPDHLNRGELTLDEIKRVLDDLASLGSLILTFSGGEPTQRPDFLEILREAVARRFVTIVKSNGILDREFVHEMHRRGLYELQVSLYAAEPQPHDQFVGEPGAWEKSVASLKEFSRLGGRVNVNIILMNWNLDQALALQEMCEREKWQYSYDFRVEQRLDGNVAPRSLRVAEEKMIAAGSKLKLIRKASCSGSRNEGLESSLCGIGQLVVVIQPDGNVIPCVATPWISMGNVRKDSLTNIWKTDRKRAEYQQIKWKDAEICRTCELLPDCQRCLSTAVLEHGDARAPSKLDCQMATVWRGIRNSVEDEEPK